MLFIRSLKTTKLLRNQRDPITSFAHHLIASKRIHSKQFVPHYRNLINCAKRTFSTTIITMSSEDIKTLPDLVDVVAGCSTDVVREPTKIVSAVRNVQTQHGDYRSVDEENIVVLRNCVSPVPTRAVKAIDDTGDDGDEIDAESETDAEQVVWIEPFSEVSVFFRGRSFFHLPVILISYECSSTENGFAAMNTNAFCCCCCYCVLNIFVGLNQSGKKMQRHRKQCIYCKIHTQIQAEKKSV